MSGGLLAFLLHRVDLERMSEHLAEADGRLLVAALLVYLGGQALSAVKWRLLARAVGFRETQRRFVVYYFIGMFFNAFGLGTVGGDVVRAMYLSGRGGRRALALNTVLADRMSGLMVLVAIAIAALVAFPKYALPRFVVAATLGVGFALLAGWRLSPMVVPRLLAPEHRLRRLVETDLAPYWHDRGLLAGVAAISFVFHLSQIFVMAMLTYALGLSIPWSYFFIFGPIVNVFSALPISLNGLGVREGGYVFFLSHIGVPSESAVAFALAWFAIVLLSGLFGGVVYLQYGSAGS